MSEKRRGLDFGAEGKRDARAGRTKGSFESSKIRGASLARAEISFFSSIARTRSFARSLPRPRPVPVFPRHHPWFALLLSNAARASPSEYALSHPPRCHFPSRSTLSGPAVPPGPNRVRTSTRSTSIICHLIISRIAATRYSGRQRSGPGPGTSAETQTLPPAVTCPVYHSHRGATTRTNGGESGKEATSKMISRRSEAGAPWRAWNAARSALSRSPPGRDASKS